MTEINNRIEEVKKIPLEVYHRMELFWHEPETADIVIDLVDGEGEASPLTERLISVLYQLGYRLFPQTLDEEPLLTPEEREVALEDMRERAGCGDSEQEPSLDDCVYIGSVYQLEKDKTKLRALPQPLDDKELREKIKQLHPIDNSNLTALRFIDFEAGFRQAKKQLNAEIRIELGSKAFEKGKREERESWLAEGNKIIHQLRFNKQTVIEFWQAVKGGE